MKPVTTTFIIIISICTKCTNIQT